MKKTFKKLTATLMAVASLAVGVTGIGANAANRENSPNYGGSSTFNVGGISVTKYIDGYKSTAAGSTTCNSSYCTHVYVSVTGHYSAGGTKNDYFSATRGKASVGFGAESGSFKTVTSYHSANVTIGTTTSSGSDDMYVTIPL